MAIPEKFKNLANAVRDEIYGKDVREAIAKSIEETGESSETAIESSETAIKITEQLIDGSFDEAELTTEIERRLNELEEEYAPELNSVKSQLAQKANEQDTYVYAPSPSSYWVAPEQPAARIDIENHFTDGFAYNADEYINTLFEPLRNEHPGYITRNSLGKDQSGTYDVWLYDFKPDKYEKTIIVIGCLHGGEVMGMLPFYRFMKEVSDNWKASGNLSYIRHKVRIIAIPILNPWGLSQSPRTRQNSNGVDINRNFDVHWPTGSPNPGDHGYRGESPFSEKETQYVRDLILDHPEATSVLDLHALGAGRESKGVIYVPRSGDVSNHKEWIEFLKWFVPDDSTYEFNYSINSTCSNYASIVHGLYASTPEWPSESWGESPLDGTEITKATEYFGNIIIMHSKLRNRGKVDASVEPVTFFANYEYSSGNIVLSPTSSYEDINELTMELDVPSSGIILMNGELTAVSSNPDAVNYFMPSIGQEHGLFNPNQNYGVYHEKYYSGGERTVIPFAGAYPVKLNAADSPASAGKLVFKIKCRMSSGEGTIEIRRYHMALTFIPSSRADAVKYYTAENGGTMDLDHDGFRTFL